MNETVQTYRFIKCSSNMSPNVIDWIRSIYFSLFGSSMLTLGLKWSNLIDSKQSICALIIFVAGVLCFLLGLLASVNIANRFKKHEKNYDGLSDSTRSKKQPEIYYYEQEIDSKYALLRSMQHILFYLIWVPAILFIGYAGFYVEGKSAKSSSETNAVISNINSKVQQIEEKSQKPFDNDSEKKQLQEALDATRTEVNRQQKEIELLNKSKVLPKPKANK